MKKLHTIQHLSSAEDRLALEQFKPWQPNARRFLAEMLRRYRGSRPEKILTVIVLEKTL